MTSGRDRPPASALRHLKGELGELERRGLLRVPVPGGGERLILCSNDYLGYGEEPWPGEPLPGGAGASRLVSGDHPAHAQLEQELARWLGVEAALVFSSGYAANVGVLSALAGPGDVIVSDTLNHASIIDGCRLSGATIVVAPHNAPGAVDDVLGRSASARRRWVVTESYFSMDADVADLGRLREICDRHDAALIVDEAHALGVFGAQGGGLCREAGVRPDVLVGTLGKAVGLQGAFVAGSADLRAWLWNRARSFVFSTGLSPALAGAAAARVQQVAANELGRRYLHERANQLRAGLAALGIQAMGRGPIIPWQIGDPAETVRRSLVLRDQGVFVQAIRPPTVPAGTSRLRITAHAKLSGAQVERALAAFALVTR